MTESSAAPDPRVGSVIQDRYKILAIVASGGMGVVYRGERLQLGRLVAIKFLHPWIAAQRSFLERFEVEARAMSRLAHPNCASVIDFGIDEVPFLVMDFVAGRTLRLLIENEGRLAPTRALGLIRQILSGLAHAHAQGIIHRDLKPENIIVSDAAGLVDHVRILDFGLAKLHDGPALTVGMAIGTPSCMAPEQTLEDGVVDVRTDIYAVGILLFEMLTGRKPFVSDKLAELIVMQQRQPAPRMSTVADGAAFSDALEAVVAKALAKAPADRFASADEMAAALEQVPESKGASATAAATAAPGAGNVAWEAAELSAARTIAGGYGEAERSERGGGGWAGAEGRANPSRVAINSDGTLMDLTIVDAPRPIESLPSKPTPPQAGTLQRFWEQWSRRQWWVGGASAGVSLVIILVWALLRDHPRSELAVGPPVASVPAVAPVAGATDELAPMTPDGTPGLADAAQLVRLGLRDQAITVLQDIRRNHPRSAYANFLLAVVYFEKMWWSIGLQHAQAAMQADPAYRRSPRLAKLLVHSLISDSFWEKGAASLKQDLAEVATPHLEEAAQSDRSPRVRARAAQLLASGFPSAAPGSGGRQGPP